MTLENQVSGLELSKGLILIILSLAISGCCHSPWRIVSNGYSLRSPMLPCFQHESGYWSYGFYTQTWKHESGKEVEIETEDLRARKWFDCHYK